MKTAESFVQGVPRAGWRGCRQSDDRVQRVPIRLMTSSNLCPCGRRSKANTGRQAREVSADARLRLGRQSVALVGYTHRMRVVHTPERAHQVAPHVHRVFSNLKAWLNGTYHGRYLDESVFRFNQRNTPMAAFQALMGISSQKAPLPLRDLVVLSQP